MKRLIICILALAMMLSLSGCFYVKTTYNIGHDRDEIDTIEIYYLGDDEYLVDATPVASIDETEYEEFVRELSGLPFEDFIILLPVAIDPNFYYYDYVVKITYENGAYELISPNGVQDYFDENGKDHVSHYECDDEAWNAFIEKYIEE